MLVRYERLPDFYYNIGKIGYVHCDCPNDKKSRSLEVHAYSNFKYHPWLKTSTRVDIGCQAKSVNGKLIWVACQNHEDKGDRVQSQPFVHGENGTDHRKVPGHGFLPNDGSKGDNKVALGYSDSSIASGAFNGSSGDPIFMEDNSWEINLGIEGVIGSIGPPSRAIAHTITYEKDLFYADIGMSRDLKLWKAQH